MIDLGAPVVVWRFPARVRFMCDRRSGTWVTGPRKGCRVQPMGRVRETCDVAKPPVPARLLTAVFVSTVVLSLASCGSDSPAVGTEDTAQAASPSSGSAPTSPDELVTSWNSAAIDLGSDSWVLADSDLPTVDDVGGVELDFPSHPLPHSVVTLNARWDVQAGTMSVSLSVPSDRPLDNRDLTSLRDGSEILVSLFAADLSSDAGADFVEGVVALAGQADGDPVEVAAEKATLTAVRVGPSLVVGVDSPID